MKNKFKVIFWGLGSIGKRHLKNLKEIATNRGYSLEIHSFKSKRSSNHFEGVKEIYNIEDLDNDYDITFITNPTSMHHETLKIMDKKSNFFFIEKPVFANYTNIKHLHTNPDYIYVASPLRYKKIIKYIQEVCRTESVYNARSICSSYLPDWRQQDYRLSYSAIPDLGGGVDLDLIHELDYIIYIFGIPKTYFSERDKVSNLEIKTFDTANYILKYNNNIVEIHLDYFGRVPVRKLELITDKNTYEFDFNNNYIKTLDNNKIIQLSENRNFMYIKELEYFFDKVVEEVENSNNLFHAIEVLKIAKGE